MTKRELVEKLTSRKTYTLADFNDRKHFTLKGPDQNLEFILVSTALRDAIVAELSWD